MQIDLCICCLWETAPTNLKRLSINNFKSGIKIKFSNVSHRSQFPTKFHFVIISTIVISSTKSLCHFHNTSCLVNSYSFNYYSFSSLLSLLVSRQQPTRKLCYFGCCTLIHNLYKLYIIIIKFSTVFVFYTCFFSFLFYLNSVSKDFCVVMSRIESNIRIFQISVF